MSHVNSTTLYEVWGQQKLTFVCQVPNENAIHVSAKICVVFSLWSSTQGTVFESIFSHNKSQWSSEKWKIKKQNVVEFSLAVIPIPTLFLLVLLLRVLRVISTLYSVALIYSFAPEKENWNFFLCFFPYNVRRTYSTMMLDVKQSFGASHMQLLHYSLPVHNSKRTHTTAAQRSNCWLSG